MENRRLPLLFITTMLSMLPGIATAQGRNDSQQETKQVALWAGISVPQPTFGETEAKKIQVSFALVNDGTSTVDPKIGDSHLSINGVEPEDWTFIINNGLAPGFHAVPPGHVVSFGYLLGERFFAKPGIYTVRWWGDNFRSEPITFRVLPPY
jgi:hypothetical protein